MKTKSRHSRKSKQTNRSRMIGHKRSHKRRYKNKNTQLMKSVRGGGNTEAQKDFIRMNMEKMNDPKNNLVIKRLASLWNNHDGADSPQLHWNNEFQKTNKKTRLLNTITNDPNYVKGFTYNGKPLKLRGEFIVPCSKMTFNIAKCNEVVSAILNIFVFVFDIDTSNKEKAINTKKVINTCTAPLFKKGDKVFIKGRDVRNALDDSFGEGTIDTTTRFKKFNNVRCKVIDGRQKEYASKNEYGNETIDRTCSYSLITEDIKDNNNAPIIFKKVKERYILRPIPKLIVRLYCNNEYKDSMLGNKREVLFYDYCVLHDHGFKTDSKDPSLNDDEYDSPDKNSNYPLGGEDPISDNDLMGKIQESLGDFKPVGRACVDLFNAQMYNIYFRGKKYYSPSGKIRNIDGQFISSNRDFETLKIVE